MTTANRSVYTGYMRWFKVILGVFLSLIFTAFILGKTSVFGVYDVINDYNPGTGGLTSGQVCTPLPCPGPPGAGLNNGGNNYSGFYLAPNGNYYPIGVPVAEIVGGNGGGGGPAETGGVCTGVYSNCTTWGDCSTSCGPGTQIQNCFDTGCGAVQTNTQACQVNDPNVWGTPTTCSVKCGTGTQNITNQCGTTVPQACNTSACPAWTKLKDSSFISPNNLFNMISLVPVAYDADDTTEQYFVVGTGGVVAAPAIDIEVSNLSSTAKTGNPEYKVIYTPTYSMTPSLFLSYVKARKEYKVITSLNEINGSGIYVYEGDITIDSESSPFDTAGNIVLISTGTVTVIRVAPATVFTPVGSAAIIAPTINFSSNLTEATGIFIGNTISTGTNTTQGLKIIGNLIAQTALSNNREWPTTTRPSLFIKFDQTKYINLLPYLSTASYQWRQIQ